jgi:hypothetical protein
MGIASVLVMPVVNDDQVLGVFELFSGKAHAFGERDLSAVQRLSEMVETAVRLAHATATLPEQLSERESSVAEAVHPEVFEGQFLSDLVVEDVKPHREEQAAETTAAAALESPIAEPISRREDESLKGDLGRATGAYCPAGLGSGCSAVTAMVDERRSGRSGSISQASAAASVLVSYRCGRWRSDRANDADQAMPLNAAGCGSARGLRFPISAGRGPMRGM